MKNRSNATAIEQIYAAVGPEEIIGSSPALRAALAYAERVASTDATVLVLGETGTGKELIAQAIHNLSPRRPRPFVKLDCAAIRFDLLESELFGHAKGAFTADIAQNTGRFEMADSGTLFLDEIGDLPPALQPKLLQILEEQQFERPGSGRARVNVRLVAATHRDLTDMVRRGEFCSDLFYRLSEFSITLPPLRERRQDIALLVSHFVDCFSRRLGRRIHHIPEETMSALTSHSWPGNVRELQNSIKRAVILSDDGVLENPLPLSNTNSMAANSFQAIFNDYQQAAIRSKDRVFLNTFPVSDRGSMTASSHQDSFDCSQPVAIRSKGGSLPNSLLVQEKNSATSFQGTFNASEPPEARSNPRALSGPVPISRNGSATNGNVPDREHGSADTSPVRPIVFVVADDISFRESMARFILHAGWQPETFAFAREFLDRPRALVPNCLVLDVSPQDFGGLDLQKRIAAERIETPIIFIADKSDVPTSVQAIKAGAVEFLIKPFHEDSLLGAIREGLRRSSITLGRESELRPLRDAYASLSQRERQVMALVVLGLLNKQVGAELGISEITVKAHRGRVMQKMGAKSIVDLVRMAAKLRSVRTLSSSRSLQGGVQL